jgi:hypothetical protein
MEVRGKVSLRGVSIDLDGPPFDKRTSRKKNESDRCSNTHQDTTNNPIKFLDSVIPSLPLPPSFLSPPAGFHLHMAVIMLLSVDLDVVVLAPLLDHTHQILHLGVRSVSNHREHILEVISRSFACDHLLEDSNTGSSLAFPVFGIRIKTLKNIKSFRGVQEVTHL